MQKYLFIGLTLALTVYAQLIIKARAAVVAAATEGAGRLPYLIGMFKDPGVLSGLAAAVLASASWTLAIQHAPLSLAYPFMALSFVLVPLMAVPLFGDALAPTQLLGILLIVTGIALTALKS